jgi:hypothetical protein
LATVVTAANIAAAITAVRIIFFIAFAPKGVWSYASMRTSDACWKRDFQYCDIRCGRAKTRATTSFVSATG